MVGTVDIGAYMKPSARRFLGLMTVGISFAGFLLAAPANADVLVRYDPSGDVRTTVARDDLEPPPPSSPEPTQTTGDITKMRITHEGPWVKVLVQFKALPPQGYYQVHHLEFKTGSITRDLRLYASLGNWRADADWTNNAGDPVSCKNLSHLIEYKMGRLTVNVPRSCLGYPPSVRVGAATQVILGEAGFTYDQAQVKGGEVPYDNNGWSPTLSPPVGR